jgi:hypothetical protein
MFQRINNLYSSVIRRTMMSRMFMKNSLNIRKLFEKLESKSRKNNKNLLYTKTYINKYVAN